MSLPSCYWPDGLVNTDLVAANVTDSSGHSACCNPGHYFFSNGLCLDNNEMTFYRGGCTDKTWASSACPRYCMYATNSVCGVWTCNNENQFACNPQDCENQTLMFTINGGIIQQNIALQSAIATATPTAASTASSSASTTSSTALPASSSITSAHPTASSSTSDVCPSHVGAYAGLSAGLGALLLISLAAIIFVMLQLRRYRQLIAGRGVNGYSQRQRQTEFAPPSNSFYAGDGYKIPYRQEGPGRPEAELPSAMRTHPRAELGGE